MAKKKMTKCIVVFDNQQGLCVPMGDDLNNPGAICCSDVVRIFESPVAAKTAITISAKYAELHKLLGKTANDDFLPPAKSCIKLMPAV